MRIIYVAKHGSGSNDDEGAIAHALESLGHEVILVQEKMGHKAYKEPGDFMLFHHWQDLEGIGGFSIPKVFWCFDLIDFSDDPSLKRRSRARVAWMRRITSLVDLGFCTDGDWVNRGESNKLVRLLQGADIRVARPAPRRRDTVPILFTGIRHGGGQGRISFVDEMRETYSYQFVQVPFRVHGRDLANLISRATIVVAPDAPATDNYWSNRVYLTLGFGGFLLHPYCKTLEDHYVDGKEIVYYSNRADLHTKINYYLDNPEERRRIRSAGYARTMAEHTYTHRCKELIQTVESRGLLD